MQEIRIQNVTREKYRECLGYLGGKFGAAHIASFGKIHGGGCVPAVVAGRGAKRVLCLAHLCDGRSVVYGLRFFEKLLENDMRDDGISDLLDRVTFVFAAPECLESEKLIRKVCAEIGFSQIIGISDGDFQP